MDAWDSSWAVGSWATGSWGGGAPAPTIFRGGNTPQWVWNRQVQRAPVIDNITSSEEEFLILLVIEEFGMLD